MEARDENCLDAWLAYPKVSTAFIILSRSPKSISQNIFDILQKYLCLVYKFLGCEDVDEARLEVVFYQAKDFNMLPQSSDAHPRLNYRNYVLLCI